MFAPAPPDAASKSGLPYLRLGILLCPGFTLTPVASFIDAFRLAADREDRSRQIYFAWDFVAVTRGPIKASCGLEVAPAGTLGDTGKYDCLVLCGGLLRDLPSVSPRLLSALRDAVLRDIPIIALCTGSFLLAESGFLDGRRCAVHFDVLGEFARRFPATLPLSGSNYIVDGNIITCPGSVVAIEVAAHLISRYGESSRARKSMNYLLFTPQIKSGSTARPWSKALAQASRATVEAVQYMEFRLDSPCSIADLAAALGTTRTRLDRAFVQDLGIAPATFWREMRLEAARELLRGRRRTITEIAYDVGFCDTAHFCRTFKARWQMTPQAYRGDLEALA